MAATYEALKQNEEAELLRKEDTINDDDKSSSGDSSTVIVKPAWLEFMDRERSKSSSRASTAILMSLMISMLGVLLLLAWVIVTIHQIRMLTVSGIDHTTGSTSSVSASTCGSTHAEALAAGCHFDIFAMAWFPRECSDTELYNMTLKVLDEQREGQPVFFKRAKGSATYYDALDLSLVQDYGGGRHHPLGISTDDAIVLGTWEHYLVSCTYAWQKVQRAAMRNWPLEEWSSSLALARKCGPDLLDREQYESHTVVSNLRIWYPKCGLDAVDLKAEVTKALRS